MPIGANGGEEAPVRLGLLGLLGLLGEASPRAGVGAARAVGIFGRLFSEGPIRLRLPLSGRRALRPGWPGRGGALGRRPERGGLLRAVDEPHFALGQLFAPHPERVEGVAGSERFGERKPDPHEAEPRAFAPALVLEAPRAVVAGPGGGARRPPLAEELRRLQRARAEPRQLAGRRRRALGQRHAAGPAVQREPRRGARPNGEAEMPPRGGERGREDDEAAARHARHAVGPLQHEAVRAAAREQQRRVRAQERQQQRLGGAVGEQVVRRARPGQGQPRQLPPQQARARVFRQLPAVGLHGGQLLGRRGALRLGGEQRREPRLRGAGELGREEVEARRGALRRGTPERGGRCFRAAGQNPGEVVALEPAGHPFGARRPLQIRGHGRPSVRIMASPAATPAGESRAPRPPFGGGAPLSSETPARPGRGGRTGARPCPPLSGRFCFSEDSEKSEERPRGLFGIFGEAEAEETGAAPAPPFRVASASASASPKIPKIPKEPKAPEAPAPASWPPPLALPAARLEAPRASEAAASSWAELQAALSGPAAELPPERPGLEKRPRSKAARA